MAPDTRFDKGMDNLRGRVLGMLESFGLEPHHERAVKSTFKALTYDLQAKVQEDIEHDLKL
jgi:hypothetical protein